MTTVVIDPTPRTAEPGSDDKPIVHAVCRTCFPEPVPEEIAMCGSKPHTLAIHPEPPADRPLCVICEELYPKPCERCSG